MAENNKNTPGGYTTKQTDIDPETGASMTSVEYLPNLEQARRDVLKLRKEFQPYKFSSNFFDLNNDITKHIVWNLSSAFLSLACLYFLMQCFTNYLPKA